MIYLRVSPIIICFLAFIFTQDKPTELIPVDAGVEDRNTLSATHKLESTSFYQDHSFERLYRVAGTESIYVRKSGALSAVFQGSEYAETRQGSIALIPAGTVYCIGEIPAYLINNLTTLESPIIDNSLRVSVERLSTRISAWPTKANHISVKHFQSIDFLENETYRRKRLASFVLDTVLSN